MGLKRTRACETFRCCRIRRTPPDDPLALALARFVKLEEGLLMGEVRLKLEEGLLLGEDRLKLDDGLPLVGFIDVCMDVASEVAFVVNDAELESWLYCRVGTCWRPPSLNRLLNRLGEETHAPLPCLPLIMARGDPTFFSLRWTRRDGDCI